MITVKEVIIKVTTDIPSILIFIWNHKKNLVSNI
jgi:hypothetical protein